MGNYKATVRHVRYWRGAVQRWSTNHTYFGTLGAALDTAAATAVLNADKAMCYGGGASIGGTWACEIYDTDTGGVPVASVNIFDPDVPATWVADAGSGWSSITSLKYEQSAEVALMCYFPAGLSRTGKPVRMRNWYHAVPSSVATGNAVDVTAANVTTLTTAYNGVKGALVAYDLVYGTKSGRFAGTAVVEPFYGNHQMPRGRRRLVHAAARAASSFPPNLLVVPGSDGSLES